MRLVKPHNTYPRPETSPDSHPTVSQGEFGGHKDEGEVAPLCPCCKQFSYRLFRKKLFILILHKYGKYSFQAPAMSPSVMSADESSATAETPRDRQRLTWSLMSALRGDTIRAILLGPSTSLICMCWYCSYFINFVGNGL